MCKVENISWWNEVGKGVSGGVVFHNDDSNLGWRVQASTTGYFRHPTRDRALGEPRRATSQEH